MLEFNKLKVKKTYIDSNSARIIEFEVPLELKEKYRYKAGQNITVKIEIEGKEERRNYSICAGEQENKLVIGVRKVSNGKISNWMFDNINQDSIIDVMQPVGRFGQTSHIDNTQHWFFAAGSGITPIISIMTTILESTDNAKVTLFYSNKTLAKTMLLEQLEDLKNKYLARLNLHFLFSQEQQLIHWANGRLNQEKLKNMYDIGVLYPEKNDQTYLCGPEDMINNVNFFLESIGIEQENIHFELFGKKGTQHKEVFSEKKNTSETKLTVKLQGKQTHLVLEGQDSLLDVGLENGLNLPFACHAGVCGTCRCKLIKGEVEMQSNYALENWEIEQNIILSCQSLPKDLTQSIEIDFDI